MRIQPCNKIITGKFAGFVSIIGNCLLFILKIWAGIVTGSVALVADAWHTLSDSMSSVILLIGLYISDKPADKNHPFGHGRAEIISSLLIGLILVLIAINFFYESISKIIEGEKVEYGIFAIVAVSVSLIGKEIMAQVSFAAAKISRFKSLKADGWHHRSDALTSAIILAGIFLGRYLWWIDGALGAFVSIMILILAYRIVNESINPLLGEIPAKELIKKIHEMCSEVYSGKIYPHHFHIHRYGDHTEMTFHIKLPYDYQLKEANEITTVLVNKIKDELDIYATIYIDIYQK